MTDDEHHAVTRPQLSDWIQDNAGKWVAQSAEHAWHEVICRLCGDDGGPQAEQNEAVRKLRGPYNEAQATSVAAGHHAPLVEKPVREGAANEKTSYRSQNLVRIVTTAYGAGITATLAVKSTAFITPLANWRLSVVVLAVTLLMIYGAYSYVMSVSEGPYAYRFTDDDERKRVRSLLRFISDLVLAALYVRALLFATTINQMNVPKLLHALAGVFVWVVVVRVLRYGIIKTPDRWRNYPSIVTLAAFGVSLGIGLTWGHSTSSSSYGTFAVGLLLATIIGYIPLIEWSAKVARARAPENDLVGLGQMS